MCKIHIENQLSIILTKINGPYIAFLNTVNEFVLHCEQKKKEKRKKKKEKRKKKKEKRKKKKQKKTRKQKERKEEKN